MRTETDGNIIIVIDPGHGGENLGAEYDTYLEKEMNMTVANAMAEELSKYEGITVYLTHTTDEDMSLKERAEFAKDVNADFLFCLHFNMSVKHDLFGSEVWVSAFGDQYAQGASYGEIQMQAMKEMGLYLRGVKTKLNDRGTDYYGILRHCTEFQIPAALIEHCHLDQVNDSVFCDSEEELIAFGKADAECVAKYFGLKSEILGVDYSDYEVPFVKTPSEAVQPDETAPEICYIEEVSANYETGEVQIQITGDDADSSMLYFSYSLDAGQTYSELKAWPGFDTFCFTFTVPSGTTPIVRVRVYNLFDLYTESNDLTFQSFLYGTQAEEAVSVSGQETVSDSDVFIQPVIGTAVNPWLPYQYDEEGNKSLDPVLSFLYLSFLAAGIVFLSALILKITTLFKKKKRHNKRR